MCVGSHTAGTWFSSLWRPDGNSRRTGSGATEGACKSVVKMRAKGSGQRWHEEGITAVLTLRSAYLSETARRSPRLGNTIAM